MVTQRPVEGHTDAINQAHERVKGAMARRSRRYTRVQQALVAFLAGCSRPLTVAELSESAALPVSSVYRNVRPLLDAEVLMSVRGPGPVEHFELDAWVLGQEHHHHLLCRGCGLVADYDAPAAVERALDEALPHIERDLGFAVSRHVVDLIGLCHTCRGHESP